MNNELLLLSKNDIPFIGAQVNIHQPTLSEISFIGEESFFSGCQFLNFSKNIFEVEDKTVLEDKSDFEVFIAIMCSPEKAIYKNDAKMVLALLFPDYQFKFTENELLLINEQGTIHINSTNFEEFKDIISSMFVLDDIESTSGGYNPASKKAERIAEKLQKAKNRKMQDGDIRKVAILSRYLSILTVGEKKDMNDFMQYTVFQLKDEFKRYQMKQSFDMYVKAQMAGAQDVEEVDNWMGDIHS